MKLQIRRIMNWLSLAFFLLGLFFLIYDGDLIVFGGYTLFAIIIFLPRIIYRRLGLHTHFSHEMLDWIEIGFSVTIVLSVAGYLWLFKRLFDYDTYVHFFSPLVCFILVAIFVSAGIQHWKVEKVHKSDVILATLVIMVSLILIWELFEYSVTIFTNKNMFFDFHQKDDTLYDVVAGFLSMPLAAVIVYKYHDWFFEKINAKNFVKKDDQRENNR